MSNLVLLHYFKTSFSPTGSKMVFGPSPKFLFDLFQMIGNDIPFKTMCNPNSYNLKGAGILLSTIEKIMNRRKEYCNYLIGSTLVCKSEGCGSNPGFSDLHN